MIVNADVKTTGEHWDDELGLWLDVDASIQRWPFWWDEVPMDYIKLQEKREEKDIEVEDQLFHVSDLDTPFHFEDGDEDE